MPQIAQARGISGISSGGGLNVNVTVARIATQCDGPALLRILEAAADRLERAVDEVNALNVYPVPDGDTGTNMLHTVRSALKHARAAEPSLAAVSAAAAHGALMGARGNSGVILSQIIRGLKDALANAEKLGNDELRSALNFARRHAHDAVTAPAPGTILTVSVAIEDAAADNSGSIAEMLRRVVAAGADAVTRTRMENPVNKAAGVVDAGAKGLWYLLDGALAELEDRSPTITAAATRSQAAPAHAVASEVSSWAGAYDVQFLVEHPTRPIGDVREEMTKFGADCVLVVGDESVMKVHVHTLQPDKIIAIGMTAGRLGDVVVEDLDAMTKQHEAATGIVIEPPNRRPTAPVGVVAVVPGAGFATVARSLGATPLRGGASMNPSTEELLAAIREANALHVVVLPNDRNVILAAQSAAKLADVEVTVIPTRTVAQGMAALIAFDAGKDAAQIGEEMREVAEKAHGIEITRASRSTTVDGQDVREGEAIALLDGRVVAHGQDEVSVLVEAAKRLTDAELFTLYSGADVDAARVQHAAQRLRAACPRVEVEVIDGGQPHYPFIVAAE
ncbi:MAG TPA: DAK2 domain-containing protein [Candidatus Limnocylindria bacterium]|nr:DAK2 domain-containing protein [Candidatus Limnocylindria bacterium]